VPSAARSASSDASNPTYHVRANARLHWAGWDDEFVVFNESSGQTHQLDALRAFVLNLLVESPRTWDEALGELRAALPSGNDQPEPNEALRAALSAFEQHGLVDIRAA
jgi:PqqD family protein of HPr-rel-A system